MKAVPWVLLVIALAVIAFLLWPNKTNTSVGLPADYFPTKVGSTWTYKITVGKADPLYKCEIAWPMGDRKLLYATRGRWLKEKDKNSYELTLRIEAKAEKQGDLEYPEGYEIKVVKDELGIYEDAKQVFWAITTDKRFGVTLVETHDGSRSPASSGWGSWGADGQSMRMYFFGEKPGVGIGIGEDSGDILAFDGIENECMIFTRIVDEQKTKSGEASDTDFLGKAFTETTTFKKGVGLNHLEQKVNGQTTMEWELVNYTPGP